MDRSPDLASGDAATKVKAALGLPETVSLLTFDPLAAAA
jgi:hypothetical protein